MSIQVTVTEAQAIIGALHERVRDDLDSGFPHTAAEHLRIAQMFLSSVDGLNREVYDVSSRELSVQVADAL